MADGDFECVAVLQEHSEDVKNVRWHPDDDILMSCSYDSTIKLWKDNDDDDWHCIQTLNGHTSTVWCCDFNRDGKMIVSCGDDNSVRIWLKSSLSNDFVHLQTIELNRTLFSVSWSKVNGMIATCGCDNAITIISENMEGKFSVLKTIKEPHGTNDVNCVSWCPLQSHGYLLASGGDDCKVAIHNLSQFNQIS